MSLRALLPIALFLVAAAGCSSKGASDTSSVPSDIQAVQVTKDTGAIRGIVVTSSITPIADASVKLLSLNITKKTTATGSFLFENLKAGTYFLSVSKLGFATVQASAIVVAGDASPPVTKVQLVAMAGAAPYVESLSWKGFIQCGFSMSTPVVYVGDNVCGEVPSQASDTSHQFLFGAGIPTFTQSEMTWDGSQPTGKALSLTYLGGSATNTDWKSSHGPSPLILNATHDEIVKKNPAGANTTFLTNRVFPESTFDNTGPQIVLNQDFRVFVTNFYNFKPRAGWTFINNGECLKPEDCA